jgi:hypothetical protein
MFRGTNLSGFFCITRHLHMIQCLRKSSHYSGLHNAKRRQDAQDGNPKRVSLSGLFARIRNCSASAGRRSLPGGQYQYSSEHNGYDYQRSGIGSDLTPVHGPGGDIRR